MKKVRILIPARMDSKRLPGKPLAMIGDRPLIRHVYDKAAATGYPVTVLTDSVKLKEALPDVDVRITADAATGTDRVASVVDLFDEDIFVNCQGDLPFIHPMQILTSTLPLDHGFDVGTIVYDISDSEQMNPNTVKAICSYVEGNLMRAHWFTRSSLKYGFAHAGVYAFRRDALRKFASLAGSEKTIEEIENLEQLRWLEFGSTIGAMRVQQVEGEVNTPGDLELARRIYEARQGMG